ncbi:MAG: NapC/NirT family cytochrome c [Anaerolineae bacterium]|nr:NapC/NirT family cytochrome c [Anaerolineae bacterium]
MFNLNLQKLGQLDFLAFTGHLLAILAVLGLLLKPAILPAIIVTSFLAVAYTSLAWRTRRHLPLYPAAFFLSVAYLLIVEMVGWLDSHLIWAIPLVVVLLGIGVAFRRKKKAEFAIPLEIIANLAVLFLTGKIIRLSNLLRVPMLVIAGLAAIAVLELVLARINRERWFLFSVCIHTALAYLFIIHFLPGGAPDSLVVYYALAAVGYSLLGLWVRRSIGKEIAEPIETAALLIGIASGLACLWDGSTSGIFALLVGAFAYVILYFSSRGEEYIYLSILSGGAIGYKFIQIAGERFSYQFVDQFLVGLAIVGIIFLYAIIRRFVSMTSSIQDWFNDGGWVRVFFVGLPLLMLVPAVGVNYIFEATANPTFCGSCHVMQNQYEAWDRNPHRDVTCDVCHYPPGVEYFIQGKVVGVTEVVNNLAGTFGTKPHGTVDNANCESCHPVADLIGLSTPFRAKIIFNHTELIPGNNSGITMRCNNCHSHIIDGFHFQVRESTCYWCHFMGQENQETVVGDCFTCHETPIDETHQDVVYSKIERDCTTEDCHSSVTVGNGEVKHERCLSCHGQIDPRAGDSQVMHDLHILSETTFLSRKVECLECHDEITHGEEVFQ